MRQLANMRPASKALGDDLTLTRWVKLPGRHNANRPPRRPDVPISGGNALPRSGFGTERKPPDVWSLQHKNRPGRSERASKGVLDLYLVAGGTAHLSAIMRPLDGLLWQFNASR